MPRLASALVVAALLACMHAPTVRADESSEIILRGNYWRDRNTRVLAPEAQLRKSLPTGTTIEAGYLLDAITSASAAAGVASDTPFTELRNEVSFRASQWLGSFGLSALYRYSSESDYWSHTAGGTLALDLFQHNTFLSAGYYYTHNDVGMRRGALGLVDVGVMQSHSVILAGSQVLSPIAIIEGCYELIRHDGYQQNPYRTVKVAGTPTTEVDPNERTRHALSAGARVTPVYRRGHYYLTLYGKFRFYIDDWGLISEAPEARAYLGLGPTELRVTGRYYHQNDADFFRANSQGLAEYTMPVMRDNCPAGCYTGDSKLAHFDSWFLEGRFQLSLGFLDRPSLPLGRWLGGGLVAVSVGYYWNSGFANAQFGNAWVGGLEITLPL
jgi:hypothetical protein